MPADGSIPDFLDRRPFVGSFTSLKQFLDCEHAMLRKYVRKDIPFVESKEMAWGNAVHAAFENRLRAKMPLPDNMRQWEQFALPFDKHQVLVEQKLGMTALWQTCDFFAKDVYFRGKIDTAIIDLQGKRAYIGDWKTGNSRYEDPFELETGAMLLKLKFPELVAIKGAYIWLKENRAGQIYDLSKFKDTAVRIRTIMNEIADKRINGGWLKKQSGLCGFCPVKDCEHNTNANA